MKKIVFLLFVAFSLNINAQDADKTVTLTVTGQGKTIDEAKTNALRSAIEQSFGAYISSQSVIKNDSLISDVITSISKGSINKYDIISQIQIRDIYCITLNIEISLFKLIQFIKSKDGSTIINVELVAQNYENELQNSISEEIIIEKNVIFLKNIISDIFNYEIEVGNPKISSENDKIWEIPLQVSVVANSNSEKVVEYLQNLLNSISLSKEKVKEFKAINKKCYIVSCGCNIFQTKYYYLRSLNSLKYLIELYKILLNYQHSENSMIVRKGHEKFENEEIQLNKLKTWSKNFLTQEVNSFFSFNPNPSVSSSGDYIVDLLFRKNKKKYFSFFAIDEISNTDLKYLNGYFGKKS